MFIPSILLSRMFTATCVSKVLQQRPIHGQQEELSPGQISPGAGAEMDKEETVSVYSLWTTSPRPGALFGIWAQLCSVQRCLCLLCHSKLVKMHSCCFPESKLLSKLYFSHFSLYSETFWLPGTGLPTTFWHFWFSNAGLWFSSGGLDILKMFLFSRLAGAGMGSPSFSSCLLQLWSFLLLLTTTAGGALDPSDGT